MTFSQFASAAFPEPAILTAGSLAVLVWFFVVPILAPGSAGRFQRSAARSSMFREFAVLMVVGPFTLACFVFMVKLVGVF